MPFNRSTQHGNTSPTNLRRHFAGERMSDTGSGAGASAPTGCYKCGRPGHWSRDCPSSSTTTNPNPNPNSTFNPKSAAILPKSTDLNPNSSYPRSFSAVKLSSGGGGGGGGVQKPKKIPKARPKLVPELLLSDDGIGYILRYFPRNFKYRGLGHEVSDLRNLLHMYKEWHAQLLPYYSFDQFVHKVEQVGSGKLVRACLRGLREKVANGGDPAKWDEPSVNEDSQNKEDIMEAEEPNQHQDELKQHQDELNQHQDKSSPMDNNADEMQEDILNEIYHQTVEEMPKDAHNTSPVLHNSKEGPPAEAPANGDASRVALQISDEQKARMEDNRLKALGRANAKARILPTS